MDRVVNLAKGKRRAEHWMAHQEALALARSGRLQAARRSSSRAVELALQEQFGRESAACYRASRAVWEAVCGNSAEGTESAPAALEHSRAGMPSTPPVCAGARGKYRPDRGLWPQIWRSASRRIRL